MRRETVIENAVVMFEDKKETKGNYIYNFF